MGNQELFHDMLKQRRLGMGAGNRKKTKKHNTSKQWLYPFQWERKYSKEISKIQRQFTVPLTKTIEANLARWIQEYNVDGTPPPKIDVFSRDAMLEQEYLWLDNYKAGIVSTEIRTDSVIHTDNFSAELRTLIDKEQQRLNKIYEDGAPLVRAMITDVGNGVSAWNLKQFGKFTKDMLGVEFFVTEPWETEVIKAWSETNFELIKSLSTEYIKTVNTLVSEGVQFGKSANEIMKGIRTVNKQITGWRSRLIARDQVGKLNGALTKRRMTDAGIDLYTWQTAADERVRAKHKTMNGKTMRWDDNTVYSDDGGKTWKKRTSDMYIGIPGQDIQCRCSAIPYFNDMIAEIDEEIEKEAA